MKKCPECQREYNDDRLNFCLDDGAELLYGPAVDEPATAVFGVPSSGGDPEATELFGAASDPTKRLAPNEPHTTRTSPVFSKVTLFAVFAIAILGGFFGYRYFSSTTAKQINSIAVMPFVNESGSADAEYLSDGMTESLISSLSQLPNLTVKARTSVFRYKGKPIDPRQIGAELNVHAVLTGRVIQRADKIALYVELIDAATEDVLWKGDYNRSMTDLVALQNEIAQDASQKLRNKLAEGGASGLAKKGETTNPEAYRLYLQGRFHWNKRRIADMGKAIGYFQQAIALDPNYALAWAGLADAVAQPSDVVPHLERRDKALAAVQKSLSLNPDSGEAHTSMAHIVMRYDLDFAGSERYLRRAFELDPKWADIYQRYGEWYMFQGRFEEGLDWLRRGLELEPFNLSLNTAYGGALSGAGRYDEAIAQLKKTIDLDPNHRNAYVGLAQVYAAKGMHAEAVDYRIRSLKLASQDVWAEEVREGFVKGGWNGFLKADLERYLMMGYSADRLAHFNGAALFCMLGDNDKSLAALERSLERREQPALALLRIDPRFIPLRNDPRFNAFLQKIGLPPY